MEYFEKANMPVKRKAADTQFLNVDLDIYSKSDLRPLVNGFGDKVIPLYVGPERGMNSAHLELSELRTSSADSSILAFCTSIRALPKTARKLWNGAKTREFSVGVQAGQQPSACDFRIEARTVKDVAELDAAIVLTVYVREKSEFVSE